MASLVRTPGSYGMASQLYGMALYLVGTLYLYMAS